MHSMFEWDDARYFLALHRATTLSAAARSLGVNQTTVGRRLAALEEQLGARVFFRTRDGYRVAPAGELLLEHAERMEEEADAIGRVITGQEMRLTGTVRLTTPDAMGPLEIVPLLAEFQGKYPDIVVEVDADDRLRNLTKREADMAIRIGRPSERSVVARKLGEFVATAYASPRYLASHVEGEPHSLITFGESSDVLEVRWLFQQFPKGRVVFRSQSTYARVQAAKAGLGVIAVGCYMGDADPDLVRVVEPSDGVRNDIWLILHRDLQHTARIRACADFLAERFKAEAARFTGGRKKKR
jgi:DNA-binding transcriptional LysR family regulator